MSRTRLAAGIIETLRKADDWVFERVGPLRILFVTTDGYGFACQSPVIRALLEHADVRVGVVHDRNLPADRISFNDEHDRELFTRLQLDTRMAAFRKWHSVVYSHVCSFHPRRHALRAYLHHGPGFGSGGGTGGAEMAQIYFGLSNAELDYLEAKSPGLFGRDRAFFPVGFPKSDALVNGRISRAEVLHRHGLPDRKTMLIVSSRNPGGLLPRLGGEPFGLLAEAFPDWTVIQTGHPWLWEARGDADPHRQERLKAALLQVERRFPNARFLPGVPAEPLAAASDVLVADFTSVVTTFALLDRPIVYFDDPERPEHAKLQWTAYREAAHVFGSAQDLIASCRAAIANPGSKRSGRKRLVELFYANPGCAGLATADVLRKTGRVCSTASAGWPAFKAMGTQARRAGNHTA